jgi:probable F420-dependent oxidoreductase
MPDVAADVMGGVTGGVAGVALGFWQDRDPMEAVATATAATEAGYGELWVGEMATFDAFALATAIGLGGRGPALVVGPLPPAVRDVAGLAMGVASVAALTGRSLHLAIGASSPVVVERWHGRSFGATAQQLRDAVTALRRLLGGERGPGGYRLRLPAVAASISVAAFGPATVRVAAELADRMVVNLCTPDRAADLRRRLDEAAASAGRGHVPIAAWVPAAVDPTDDALEQLRRGLVAYLAAPGYGEMFAAAGFADLVELARGGVPPGELLERVPGALVDAVAAVGDEAACRRRVEALHAAGVDEVIVVPATAGDPAGADTLAALAPTPS